MSLQWSSRTVPGDASVKEQAGLVFGCVVTPFDDLDGLEASRTEPFAASDVGRCSSCGSYVNPFVRFTSDRKKVTKSWMCSVCGHENLDVPPRYADVVSDTASLKELKNTVMDYTLGEPEDGELGFIFVVDVATDDAVFLDLVKNCLMAALEGIPKGSLVGLLAVSDIVSIFDLSSAEAMHAKKVVVPEDVDVEGADVIGIEELLPISRFLVPFDDSNEALLLDVIGSLHEFAKPGKGKRGTGTVVRMVADYLQVYKDLSGVRVGMFLGGRPNYGAGGLGSERLLDIEPETDFYQKLAAACPATWDLFFQPLEGETLGLAALKFLPLWTGGVLVGGVQPQDLYRLYQRPSVHSCELVLRTSPDIAVSVDYQEHVSISSCTSRDSFSYDFEYTSSGGTYSEHLVAQAAFAYTALVGRGRKQRFLRVITSRAKSSLSWRMVYPAVVPEVQLTLLVHKLVRACFDEGVDESRGMLYGWLKKVAELCAHHNVSLGIFQNLKVQLECCSCFCVGMTSRLRIFLDTCLDCYSVLCFALWSLRTSGQRRKFFWQDSRPGTSLLSCILSFSRGQRRTSCSPKASI